MAAPAHRSCRSVVAAWRSVVAASLRLVRPLTSEERAVLRAVVLAEAPQDECTRSALLAQVDAAQVAGSSCPCGCASVAVQVDRGSAPRALARELHATASRGDEVVGFRVVLEDGYLADVEIFGFGDADDTSWPHAHAVDQVPRAPGG